MLNEGMVGSGRSVSLILGFAASSFFLSSALLATTSSPGKTPTHRRALIIGLDGTTGNQLHYRALIQNQAPNIAELMRTGKFAPCIDEKHPSHGGHLDPRCARAQSGHRTADAFRWRTAPGWGSVLTGVDNVKHLVKDNDAKNQAVFARTTLEHPTFMKRLVAEGLKTAAGGVSSFMTSDNHGSVSPGIIDYECGADAKHNPLVKHDATSSCNLTFRRAGDEDARNRDVDLAYFMEAQIADPETDLIMGVFDKIDSAGHHSGFSSNANYLNAISNADELVGGLIKAVETGVRERGEEWLVIVTADHGGHNLLLWGNHDVVDKEDDAIPFVIKTFGSAEPLQELTYPVTHMDVHPTVLSWFGISATPGVDGHVQSLDAVKQVFDRE